MFRNREISHMCACTSNLGLQPSCGENNKLWKILKEIQYQTTLPTSWEIGMQVKKQQLEPDMVWQKPLQYKRKKKKEPDMEQ